MAIWPLCSPRSSRLTAATIVSRCVVPKLAATTKQASSAQKPKALIDDEPQRSASRPTIGADNAPRLPIFRTARPQQFPSQKPDWQDERRALPKKPSDMTDLLKPTRLPSTQIGLHIFTDGCFEPGSGQGGWAFVVYRHGIEIAAECGGVGNTANNAMEAMALLHAALWINCNAVEEPAVIWSDSLHVVRGCNSLRHIWKRNGWKKVDPNPKARRRTISDLDVWKAIDLQLSRNQLTTIAWCKGHFGIDGNERADELANKGRLSVGVPVRPI